MNTVEIEIDRPDSRTSCNDNNGWLCTAIVVPEYKHTLSENSVSYWCYLDQYDMNVRIGKQGKAGQRITKLRQNKVSMLAMERAVLAAALEKITGAQFVSIVESARDQGIIEGKNAVRRTLKHILEEE